IELFVIIIGFVIPLITLSKIKCPNCNIRLVLHYLNGGDKYKKLESPFISTCCPNCGYEP
ncbi:hypothetical protein KJ828_02855, partial [Patescibacteria group bacterium]|nr:hypothetical protein [Patescibacteria group bacterium]